MSFKQVENLRTHKIRYYINGVRVSFRHYCDAINRCHYERREYHSSYLRDENNLRKHGFVYS